MIKEVFLWIEFILSLSWPLLFCWPFTLFGITAIGNKTVLFTCRFSQRKGKKISPPEEFFILQDFLSLRLLFCCRMCYTTIGLQRQYAVIYLRLTRAHTVFAGINTRPTLRVALTGASLPAAPRFLGRHFSRAKTPKDFSARENRMMTRKRTPAYWRMSRTMTQSAPIFAAEKRVCPC